MTTRMNPPVRAADDEQSALELAQALSKRAAERFGPKAGDPQNTPQKADRLRFKLHLLELIAGNAPKTLTRVARRPMLPLLLVLLGLVIVGGALIYVKLPNVEVSPKVAAPDFLQGLDALVNLVILAFAALIGALKLRDHMALVALRSAIRPIRDLADRLYMLQLQKDPERILRGGDETANTPHSPKTKLNMFELHRYLSYVREALAILSWLASQYSNAATTDEGADLAGDLARHILNRKGEVDRKWERVDAILQRARLAQTEAERRQAAATAPASKEARQ